MSDIYTNDLLELAADIPHIGRLSDTDGSACRGDDYGLDRYL